MSRFVASDSVELCSDSRTTLGRAQLEQSHCEDFGRTSFRRGVQTLTLADGTQLFGSYRGELLRDSDYKRRRTGSSDGTYRNTGGSAGLSKARGTGVSGLAPLTLGLARRLSRSADLQWRMPLKVRRVRRTSGYGKRHGWWLRVRRRWRMSAKNASMSLASVSPLSPISTSHCPCASEPRGRQREGSSRSASAWGSTCIFFIVDPAGRITVLLLRQEIAGGGRTAPHGSNHRMSIAAGAALSPLSPYWRQARPTLQRAACQLSPVG